MHISNDHYALRSLTTSHSAKKFIYGYMYGLRREDQVTRSRWPRPSLVIDIHVDFQNYKASCIMVIVRCTYIVMCCFLILAKT
jgi:hypothetical protein